MTPFHDFCFVLFARPPVVLVSVSRGHSQFSFVGATTCTLVFFRAAACTAVFFFAWLPAVLFFFFARDHSQFLLFFARPPAVPLFALAIYSAVTLPILFCFLFSSEDEQNGMLIT
jgi:hypothetical protein